MTHSREKFLIGALLAGMLLFFLISFLMAQDRSITLQSLGVPRCAFQVLFGKPCPLCGGYEGFTAALRGDLAGAWDANPFAVLFLFSLLVFAAGLAVALVWPGSIRPWLRSRFLRVAAISWGLILLFILVFFWICRL